jgi:hypothetical protein
MLERYKRHTCFVVMSQPRNLQFESVHVLAHPVCLGAFYRKLLGFAAKDQTVLV